MTDGRDACPTALPADSAHVAAQKQARGLTADGLAAIQATAFDPQPGRGGRLESVQAAEVKGRLDIAIVSLMRDALLRVSEAAALTWGDIEADPGGRRQYATPCSGFRRRPP